MKILVFALFLTFPFAQQLVDGLVAIVGENAILQSDVLQAAQLQAMQNRVDLSSNSSLMQQYMEESLDILINQNVILDIAEKDTLIFVADDELEMALEQQIDDMLARAGSKDKLEEALEQSLRSFKNEYRIELYRMMLIEKYQQSFVQNIAITRTEVIDFFETFKDSLPVNTSKSNFSIIEIPVTPSAEAYKKTLDLLNNISDSLKSSADFSAMAKKYSEDPGTAINGGDLGYIQRGTLVKEYEEVAYLLDINEISEPVKTNFGYHIIKLLDKQGEKIRTRHILRTVKPSENDKNNTINSIREIYYQIENNPEIFDSLANFYSDKFENYSGVHGWISDDVIVPAVLSQINDLQENQFSYPFELSGSFCIVYLYDKKQKQKPTLDDSWEFIKNIALQKKISDEFQVWVNGVKERTFIEIF